METQRRHHSARAGNGTRTRDPNLGKVVLYQLSYSRVPSANLTASYLDVVAVSSVFAPVRELFGLCPVTQGDPGLIGMPKHIRRKKTSSPARAKPRAAARAVAAAAPAKPAPAKKRGRRRGLLSGLGTNEHERDLLH